MTQKSRSDAFDAAFEAFQKLSTEEKTTFLVETVVGTVVTGLEEVSEAVTDAVRRAAESCKSAGDATTSDDASVADDTSGPQAAPDERDGHAA